MGSRLRWIVGVALVVMLVLGLSGVGLAITPLEFPADLDGNVYTLNVAAYTPSGDVTIEWGKELVIPSGSTLTITSNIKGDIEVASGGTLVFDSSSSSPKFDNNLWYWADTITGSGTITIKGSGSTPENKTSFLGDLNFSGIINIIDEGKLDFGYNGNSKMSLGATSRLIIEESCSVFLSNGVVVNEGKI